MKNLKGKLSEMTESKIYEKGARLQRKIGKATFDLDRYELEYEKYETEYENLETVGI